MPCNVVLHAVLTAMALFAGLSFAIYFDNSGAVARSVGLPAPTVPHNCIMSYTRPLYSPIQFCSPSNTLGLAVPTETCDVVKGAGHTSGVSSAPSSNGDDGAPPPSAPLGGDDPVNALGGSATAEGQIGFQLFSFREGGYDVGRIPSNGRTRRGPAVSLDYDASEPFRDVPVLLVPGNAGSYYDTRGMASAIALGNVRRSAEFARRLLRLRPTEGSAVTEEDGRRIFARPEEEEGGGSAEEASPFRSVSPLSYMNPTPSLLGVRPFAAGFLEMSVVHNGKVLLRAAQHVRDSVLYLRASFLKNHAAGRFLSEGSARRRVELMRHALAKAAMDVCALGSTEGHVTTPAVRADGCDTLRALVNHLAPPLSTPDDATPTDGADEVAQQYGGLRAAFAKQMASEVARVERRGLWIVGHSLGGTAARLGALLALARDPSSVAGVITMAGPNMYPPVFADLTTRQLFASMRYYYNGFCGAASDCTLTNGSPAAGGGSSGKEFSGSFSDFDVAPLPSDAEVLFSSLSSTSRGPTMPSGDRFSDAQRLRLRCMASRLVKVVSMGVGAFDKQVFYPSTSIEEEVMHSVGKGSGVVAEACPAETLAAMAITEPEAGGPAPFPIPSLRLDRSTEQLLQVGFSTTHHGINYCSQLFNVYASGIAEAIRGTALSKAFPTFAADVDAEGAGGGGLLRRAGLSEWLERREASLRTATAADGSAAVGLETVRLAVPPLPREGADLSSGTSAADSDDVAHQRRVFILIAFNRVVDSASDVWLRVGQPSSASSASLPTPSPPIAAAKVFSVPFRGDTNDPSLEDHFQPYAETNAHASHDPYVGRYHGTIVRTVALFEVSADLKTVAKNSPATGLLASAELSVARHAHFAADPNATPLRASATWFVRRREGVAKGKGDDGTEAAGQWLFTPSHAASAVLHGTSAVTQLVADGHPVLAAPLEELLAMGPASSPRASNDSQHAIGAVQRLREWALRHHHEADDHTHIIFGGMGASSRFARASSEHPTPLCADGGLGLVGGPATSSCAVPFAPPIAYFDARPRAYIFVALAPLDGSSASAGAAQVDAASAEGDCTEWEAEAGIEGDAGGALSSGKRTTITCRGGKADTAASLKTKGARHVVALDHSYGATSSSFWLYFGSRWLIRFAVATQYYQLLMAVFSGIGIAGLTEALLAAAKVCFPPNKSIAGVRGGGTSALPAVVATPLRASVALCLFMDAALALWLGFDSDTPFRSDGGGVGPSAVGSRDEWWGVPSTLEEVCCRFFVQCLGAYVAHVVLALLGVVGLTLSRLLAAASEGLRKRKDGRSVVPHQPKDTSAAPTTVSSAPSATAPLLTPLQPRSRRVTAALSAQRTPLALWVFVVLASTLYFTHYDVPLIMATVLGGAASIGLAKRRDVERRRTAAARRGSGVPPADTVGQLQSQQNQAEASPKGGECVGAPAAATLTRRPVAKGGVAAEGGASAQAAPKSVVPSVAAAAQSLQPMPTLLLPRLTILTLLFLVFSMFFFTIRNDVMVAMAAAGQEALYEGRGADGSGGGGRGASHHMRKPSAPSMSAWTFARVLVTGSSGHFTPRPDLKPSASWEQEACALVLLAAFPIILVGDSLRVLDWATVTPQRPAAAVASLGTVLSRGVLCVLGVLCAVGALLVCQEPLEACPRAVVTIIPAALILLWASVRRW